jgi:glucosamine-6-phosphate deaminase
MHVVLVDNYESLSRAGADLVTAAIAAKPDASLLVATGDTPMGMYQELAARYRHGQLDTSQLRVFQLDAYLGLAPTDRRALYGWTLRAFVDPLGIAHERVVRLAGDAADPQAACDAYSAAVRAAGGFDLAILGLGPNGHLGFNEPPAPADAPTRVVELSEASMVSNARYWGGRDQVPTQAMTCGMDLLLAARLVVLLVSGEHKRAILARTLRGPITPDVPASFLRTVANTTVIADRDAMADGVS